MRDRPPPRQGLYDPAFERDACGIGLVADLHGNASRHIVRQALTALVNLGHRGACGCEADTGDGAGILMQLPHGFLREAARRDGVALPGPGAYGVGMVFLPRDAAAARADAAAFDAIAAEEGLRVLGWRTVPTSAAGLGKTARSAEPAIRQVFLARPDRLDAAAFERKLYVVRRRAERALRGDGGFYLASLSARTIVYKGMLLPRQLEAYFPDLADASVVSALALVHSRFSTNTFPSWSRAHPYRCIIHNGEINTLRGNINGMRAREAQFVSDAFGDDLPKVLPVIDDSGSDSAMFDNVLEFLVLAGRPLPQAALMMIPEPWENHESMSEAKRDFYAYHATLMEPWDGPASIAFTDGVRVGAVLDRNGLRPSRYIVTRDDALVLASEVGVLDLPPDQVRLRGRLQPGRMLLVDTAEGRIVGDDELKEGMAAAHPYRAWLQESVVPLEDLPEVEPPPGAEADPAARRDLLLAFGYTLEDLRFLMAPMAKDGVEPIGSMGTDTPLAVLSDRPQLLYAYFHQLFAQVTNPPIDAIREELVTASDLRVGSTGNLLARGPAGSRQVRLRLPILRNAELEALRRVRRPGLAAATLPMLFDPAGGGPALAAALDRLFAEADRAIAAGASLLILSDRGVGRARAPIPALLATAGLHHHLIRQGTRMRAGLVVESAEPREVHHVALLLGYGAGAVNPYLALAAVEQMAAEGQIPDSPPGKASRHFVKASVKGVVKVMSKMGISTLASYRGAQVFEAVGLGPAVIDRFFTWTPSRVGGIGLEEIAREAAARHARAFPAGPARDGELDSGGQYQWRSDGEPHLFDPGTIARLREACRTGDARLFGEYSALVNDRSKRVCTLRGLLRLKPAAQPVPLEEVEPVESIVRRFKTGAMSYGSISQEAHEALAIAMNRLGGKSNTGEGGEDPARFVPDANGDSRCSAIKQVASGRFGVTSAYLVSAREIQIKMAQGAKPGEGGQLPGHKVYPWIARTRHSTPGVGLISPPPHHDIYSIEDLAQLIHDLKNANDGARISVKLVSEVGVGTIAAGVAKARADVILVSGWDGGTGASPLTSIKHAGLPWELGLAEAHQTLILNDLRSRVVLETDGQLKTGRDVVIAALLGAEEFGFATAPLVTLGCVMMRACHKNTCPVGVATQDGRLRKRFTGDPAHVVSFMRFVAQEVRELMASLGFRTVDEMVGRTDRLERDPGAGGWKTRGLDLAPLLHRPDAPPAVGRRHATAQDHGLDATLDRAALLEICRPAIERGERVRARLPVRNVHRTVGTQVGSAVTRRWGAAGLPPDTIHLSFNGSAGQSFGAFVPRGVTLELEGDANDYLGKGLSGGTLIAYPPAGTAVFPGEHILIGNVALYGATGGEAYIRGVAGERFAVRNSGARAVVEGMGDHGCEYMTGGRVVVLGPTGRNFAAGMSGGLAYVLDAGGGFARHCNTHLVHLERLEDQEEEDVRLLRAMIRRHAELTSSDRAWRVLALWDVIAPKFVVVVPKDEKRVREAMRKVLAEGLTGEAAVMAAFEANVKDGARMGGN
jgi:glutamate synthase domain-containing protein 2/glutamate synthase domain-containing protein 1/glutamate synthase domain-containing protein 3